MAVVTRPKLFQRLSVSLERTPEVSETTDLKRSMSDPPICPESPNRISISREYSMAMDTPDPYGMPVSRGLSRRARRSQIGFVPEDETREPYIKQTSASSCQSQEDEANLQPRAVRHMIQVATLPKEGSRVDYGKLCQEWLQALAASLPLVLLSYSSCVSYANLIVAGTEKMSGVTVTSMHLVSSGITSFILPIHSRTPLIVPSADISVTLFYKAIVTDITKAASPGLDPEVIGATALLALPLNTILISLILWFVGARRLTVVVSYLPYSVIAGFLGSIGWAIFAGCFVVLDPTAGLTDLVTKHPFEFLSALFIPVSSFSLRYCRVSPRLVAVLPMLVAVSAFWALVIVGGEGVESWREAGWLFPEGKMEPFWKVWTTEHVSKVDWSLIIPNFLTFTGLGSVLLLSLTLRIAGIEGSTGSVLDIDSEVKWTGIANLGTGILGTVLGSHSPGLTTFNVEAGSEDARPSLITGGLQIAVWAAGVPAINLFPRFLLAGILMNLGIMMLLEWMWASRRKVGYLGLLGIYVQVGSAAIKGLLPSVLIGCVVACVIAYYQLMTTFVLKFHVSGHSIKSYSRIEACDLVDIRAGHGHTASAVEALGLEGYLAEGPMLKFSTYLRRYMQKNRRVQYVIIDFRFTQGSNASACALLSKLDKFLQEDGTTALYTNMEDEMASRLIAFGVDMSRIYDHDTAYSTSFQLALTFAEKQVRKQMTAEAAPNSAEIDIRTENRGVNAEHSTEKRNLAISEFLGCSAEQVDILIRAGASWELVPPETKLVVEGRIPKQLGLVPAHCGEVTEMVDVGQCHGPPHQICIAGLGFIAGGEGVLYEETARATVTATEETWVLWVIAGIVSKLKPEHQSLVDCIARATAQQMLRRGDALVQAVELNKGGGWRGVHFDRRTAKVTSGLNTKPGRRTHEDAASKEVATTGGASLLQSLIPKAFSGNDLMVDYAQDYMESHGVDGRMLDTPQKEGGASDYNSKAFEIARMASRLDR